MNITIQI